MKHLSGVVQQLKKERERAQKQVQRIDEALAALGSVSSNGSSRTMSAAGRRTAQDQSGAEGEMGEAKSQRSRSEAEGHDLSGGPQTDRSGAASQVGEGEERSVVCGTRGPSAFVKLDAPRFLPPAL